MKGLITLILASQFLGVAALAESTAPPGSAAGSTSPRATVAVNEIPQSSVIRILTPVANQTVAISDAVDVRFEIVSPANATGTPNFLIQLDGNDPIRTTSMQQTFTRLASGPHTVTIELVDANNTLVAGSRAMVQFLVVAPANSAAPALTAPGGITASHTNPQTQQANQGRPRDPAVATSGQKPLPAANSLLPLVSVIGFGVLVGGIASAMKTR
jgi:hypothetical protein